MLRTTESAQSLPSVWEDRIQTINEESKHEPKE